MTPEQVKRGLDRIEARLPTSARVVAWLQDTIAQHDSIEDYASWLGTEGKACDYPLIGLLTAVQIATRHQGGSRSASALRDSMTIESFRAARLVQLAEVINLDLLQRKPEFEAALLLLTNAVDRERLLVMARADGRALPANLLCGEGSDGRTLLAYANGLRSELCAVDEAVTLTAKQSFGGRPILFLRQKHDLSGWLESVTLLAKCLRVTDSALNGSAPEPESGVEAEMEAARERAQELSDGWVRLAEAGALSALGYPGWAAKLAAELVAGR